jgi:hypothetical protein
MKQKYSSKRSSPRNMIRSSANSNSNSCVNQLVPNLNNRPLINGPQNRRPFNDSFGNSFSLPNSQSHSYSNRHSNGSQQQHSHQSWLSPQSQSLPSQTSQEWSQQLTQSTFFAGSRFSDAPSPALLPKPPKHWVNNCFDHNLVMTDIDINKHIISDNIMNLFKSIDPKSSPTINGFIKDFENFDKNDKKMIESTKIAN